MALTAERRLSSVTLGGTFLGLMMAWLGFLPQEGTQQPVPIWIWRTIGVGGLTLMASALPARWIRAEWARKVAMAGLGLTTIPLGLLVSYGVMQGRFNPFTTLLALGVLACVKGIMFYNAPEIRNCFQKSPPPVKPPDPSSA